jgi:uncharacterized protein YcfJ
MTIRHSLSPFGLALCSLAVAVFAGCSETPQLNSTQTGALAGTALGAGIGAIIGDQVGNTGSGTAIGAGIGALGGALIGGQADRQNSRLSDQDERLRRQEEEIRRQRRELDDLRRGNPANSDAGSYSRDSYSYPSDRNYDRSYDDRREGERRRYDDRY